MSLGCFAASNCRSCLAKFVPTNSCQPQIFVRAYRSRSSASWAKLCGISGIIGMGRVLRNIRKLGHFHGCCCCCCCLDRIQQIFLARASSSRRQMSLGSRCSNVDNRRLYYLLCTITQHASVKAQMASLKGCARFSLQFEKNAARK